MKIQRIAVTALLLLVAAPAAAQEVDPCDRIDCGGHGICAPYEGQPTCACEPGYAPDDSGLICIPESELEEQEPSPDGGSESVVTETPGEGAEGEEDQAETPPGVTPDVTEPEGTTPPETTAPDTQAEIEGPSATPTTQETEPAPPATEESWGAPSVPVEQPQPPVEPEPAVQEPATVAVTFESARGRRQIAITAGGETHRCLTPCTLDLPPGAVSVGPHAGQWEQNVELTVPETDSVATLSRGEHGRGLRTAGIILTAAGIGGVIIGLGAGAAPNDAAETYGPAAWAALPSGAALITGIVLLALAPESYRIDMSPAQPSPPPEQTASRARNQRRPQLRSLGVAPTDGGAAVGALLTF